MQAIIRIKIAITISNHFALSFEVVSKFPGHAPYNSSSNNLPFRALSSLLFIGPKSFNQTDIKTTKAKVNRG